jgi:hypothetical protein
MLGKCLLLEADFDAVADATGVITVTAIEEWHR